MTSTFAWLDFADRDRKRALELVDLFREEDTRDELGLGVIRDAFSDRFFPGTSTIQTRARYLLFIPWLFRDLSARDATSERFASRARSAQDRLRASLVAGGEKLGVVGFRAGRAVQRLPSSVYWQGLRRLGVLRFNGSETEYVRALARSERPGSGVRTDDGEPTDDPQTVLWDPRLPPPPQGWLNATTFEFTPPEADYLTHRVSMSAPDSLLAYLLRLGLEPGDARFAWEQVEPESLPADLGSALTHARNFSESMHGTALLYNLLLAEAKKAEDLVETYRTSIAAWWQARARREAELHEWNRVAFWSLVIGFGARVTPPSRSFVESWLDAVEKARRVDDILGSEGLRRLIGARERMLKGPRARLDNRRALDLWQGASGTAQLDYRWSSPVRDMLSDLIRARRQGA